MNKQGGAAIHIFADEAQRRKGNVITGESQTLALWCFSPALCVAGACNSHQLRSVLHSPLALHSLVLHWISFRSLVA